MQKKNRYSEKFILGVFFLILTACGPGMKNLEEAISPNVIEVKIPQGMVYISEGPFLMGSTVKDGLVGIEVGVDEIPQHSVFLKGFFIDRFEVSNKEYRKFRDATGHPASALLTQEEFTRAYPHPEDNHPVIDVNWYDANAYCRWLGRQLPTEAQWEKAARGIDGQIWPWGNETDSGKTNTRESKIFWTKPVGSMVEDVSPYGVFDMAGNAMEWTDSWYDAYPGSTLQRVAFGKSFKVLKGASWGTEFSPFSRTGHRHAVLSQLAQPDFGLRCAKKVE